MISRQEVIAAEQKRIEPLDTTAHTVKHIKCQQGGYHRRLADVTVQGVQLYCKECRRAHLVSWEELALLHEEFRLVLVQSQVL